MSEQDARKIFQHWNDKSITKHRQFDRFRSCINARINPKNGDEPYTVDEVIGAIDNYAEILHGDEYYWTHVWRLDQFLQRAGGLDAFLTENNPQKRFATGNTQRGFEALESSATALEGVI